MKNVILFAVVTFIMVIIWIGFSIYHNQTSSTVTPNIASQIDPIVARFDTQTLDSLKRRKSIVVTLSQSLQLLGSIPLLSSQSAGINNPSSLLLDQSPASESAEIIPDQGL